MKLYMRNAYLKMQSITMIPQDYHHLYHNFWYQFNNICKINIENRLFFKCPSSQNVWNMAGYLQVVSNATNNNDNAQTIIFQILQQLSKEDSSVFSCICGVFGSNETTKFEIM
jgi:lysyl-tRNA synthetase class I